MRFDIITIFPGFFTSFKNEALIARAQKKPAQGRSASGGKLILINVHNLRDWTTDNHKTVDDRPYGGGAGMVLKVEPIIKAVEAISSRLYVIGKNKKNLKLKTYSLKQKVILFSAKGKKFDQAMARKWAKLDQLIMICGRYEGVDERVAKYIADEEISIGDYVLFGGEVPAMVVMEAVSRLIPGVVAKSESVANESFSSNNLIFKIGNLKLSREHPHYTRPEEIKIAGKNRQVPKVLLSGDHKKVEEWRKKHSR